jgi:predicted Zn-dependent peptidase
MATAMAAQNQSTDSSVFALISAFTNGLDVFKKLRERKAKKKRKQQEELEAAKEEVRLSQSLSRGPMDIRSEYENNYALHGERYREGDGEF